MSRRACAIVLLVAGIAAIVAGADILLEVREYLEHGPLAAMRRFAVVHSDARREQLAAYQLPGILLVVIGPLALLAAYVLWPIEPVPEDGDKPPARRKRARRRR